MALMGATSAPREPRVAALVLVSESARDIDAAVMWRWVQCGEVAVPMQSLSGKSCLRVAPSRIVSWPYTTLGE